MPLAEALVQVAEWSAARPGLLSLTVSLVDNECDLAQRVARLAEANPTGPIRLSKKSLASLVAFALVFGAVPMVPILRSRVASPQSATAAGPPNATQVEPLDANAAAKQAGEATALIRVSGRAIDQAGTPVAGAKIYLVSTNSIDKQLGETTTNAKGTYEFRDVNLPLRTTAQGESGGTLQIYGEADGFGFAWHGMRHYQPKPRAADRPRDAHEFGFYQNEAIEMNLTFRRAADLTGSVKDENGKSVPNVQVTLRGLDYLGTEGRELQPNYREFWAQYAAPPRFREVRTDEEGRFAFHGLPAETAGHITIEHPDFPSQSFFAAITTKKITEYRFIANSSVTIVAGKLVHTPIWETRAVKTSPLDISLHSARRVAIRVLQEDKNSPAKDVRVHAASGDFATGTYATGNTDERGNVELKLPPGKYRLVADPPRDATYVRTYDELMVTAEPRDQTAEMRLKPGCILILEAVDAASGLPIADVSFWCELDGQAGSRIGVISSTTWVDHPVTNAKGELRAVVFPGKRKYGAGWSPLPSGYRADLSGTKLVNCEPGKTVRVEFKLSK
jgi:protocatechuate 3,4-dioxygenase beta subunit